MLVATWLVGCNGDKETTPDHSTPPVVDTGPTAVTDLFDQTMVSPVDILWVLDGDFDAVDDIEAEIEPVWETLLLTDPSWQMGVLDGTLDGAKFGLLEAKWDTWPPPSGAFTVPAGSREPHFEEAVYAALQLRASAPQNKDFQRSGASIYTIYVTNSEDESDRELITSRDFADWYAGISSDARIAVITSGPSRNYWRDRTVGASLFELGAIRVAIRAAILEATGLEVTFALSQKPLDPPKSVEVIYRDHATEYFLDDGRPPEDYTYNPVDNSITFRRVVPPPSSIIRIRYEVENEDAPADEAE
jgi:hypothetical protein